MLISPRPLAVVLLCLALMVGGSPALADDAPTLAFSTYLGGSDTDRGQDIAVDRDGNIYITGEFWSSDLPISLLPSPNQPGIYVIKFDPSATTVLYATYLGGGAGRSITVDATGNAYVTGDGTEIQTVNAIQETLGGVIDAFIAKLDPSGVIVYSTYLGGNGEEVATGITVDTNGNVYISGATDSTDFPTQSAFQPTYGGGQWDAFLSKINASGTALVYSTYFGGEDWDVSMDAAVDSMGNAYITGDTGSTNFPTLNALQPVLTNPCPVANPSTHCTDAYAAKFSESGALLYSTFLGGDGTFDRGNGIAVDGSGSMYIAGETNSTDFPTANPFQPENLETGMGFVTRFSPDGSSLIFSTYLGGTTGGTAGMDIDLDSEGNVIVAGATAASDFPTVLPIQAEQANPVYYSDAFVTRFSPDGQTISFSTYLGGNGSEYSEFNPHIALNSGGSIYIVGTTSSDDFPTVHAFQGELAINPDPNAWYSVDAFLTRINLSTVVPPTISPPGIAPQPHIFTTDTPRLTWNRVSWAAGYRVEVDDSDDFNAPLAFEAEVDGDRLYVITDSLPDGLYYWRVQGQRANGTWSAWSRTEQFIISTE